MGFKEKILSLTLFTYIYPNSYHRFQYFLSFPPEFCSVCHAFCSYSNGAKITTTLFFFGYADPAVNLVTSGPYGLIFASFVPFFLDIPVSTWFRVFGVRFSDKSFIYLAGLQVKSDYGLYTTVYSAS